MVWVVVLCEDEVGCVFSISTGSIWGKGQNVGLPLGFSLPCQALKVSVSSHPVVLWVDSWLRVQVSLLRGLGGP